MPRPPRKDAIDKLSRCRANQKQHGMKLVRLWLPDPEAPGFRRQAPRQALLLRGVPEEGETLDFIESAADFTEWISAVQRIVTAAARQV